MGVRCLPMVYKRGPKVGYWHSARALIDWESRPQGPVVLGL